MAPIVSSFSTLGGSLISVRAVGAPDPTLAPAQTQPAFLLDTAILIATAIKMELAPPNVSTASPAITMAFAIAIKLALAKEILLGLGAPLASWVLQETSVIDVQRDFTHQRERTNAQSDVQLMTPPMVAPLMGFAIKRGNVSAMEISMVSLALVARAHLSTQCLI
jgi:hypothetical protein